MDYITAERVQEVLCYDKLIDAMSVALCKYSGQSVVQPVRSIVPVAKEGGFLGLMPALCEDEDILGVKLVTFYPNNMTRHGVSTHNAVLVMFETRTGVPKAIMDAEVITAMRTAAVSAVATKYLAPPNASKLAILGAGVQARTHFKALSTVMDIKQVSIWTRTFENAEKLAGELGGVACRTVQEAVTDADVIVTVTAATTPVLSGECIKPGAHINGSRDHVSIWTRTFENAEKLAGELGGVACRTVQEAVTDADVIVTVTAATTPVLSGECIKPGAHINAVGACRPNWSEIDPELMRSVTLYVDSREAAVKESGDVILSKADIYAELGEMILGKKEALKTKTTLFKSLGMAIEDSMAGKLVLQLLNPDQSRL